VADLLEQPIIDEVLRARAKKATELTGIDIVQQDDWAAGCSSVANLLGKARKRRCPQRP